MKDAHDRQAQRDAQDRQAQRESLLDVLRKSGIRDQRVLDAIREVPRERFVSPEDADEAYADRALPIGGGQTISQPWVVARMTELLDVSREHHVLEVGTGWGYQLAVLSRLARDVVSVERVEELADRAAATLADLGYENVRVHHGDGSLGWPADAPYDRVMVTAACPEIPPALTEQLAPRGRIVAPVGDEGAQILTVRHVDGREEDYEPVRFVPLLGRQGFPR